MIVNIHDAKTHFSRLVDRVAKGEEIVIGRAGKPVARLVPYEPTHARRVPGAWKGKVKLAADFDTTPDAVIDAFES
jgi:prevent-host-death family protein